MNHIKCFFKVLLTPFVFLFAVAITLPFFVYVIGLAILFMSGCVEIDLPDPPVETIMDWWRYL
jgi:hypothetical protein